MSIYKHIIRYVNYRTGLFTIHFCVGNKQYHVETYKGLYLISVTKFGRTTIIYSSRSRQRIKLEIYNILLLHNINSKYDIPENT